MEKQTLSTRALLTCGAVAGPLYVIVTLVESVTRAGFDLRTMRFSWLTTGDLGWVHQLAMVGVGALTVLLALGMSRVMRSGPGSVWGPRLIGLVGVAYVVGGLLRADAVVGFPPGTTAEMVQKTWHGVVQNGSRGVSTVFLVSSSVVLARWSAAEGRRAWAWFFGAGIPAVFAVLTLFGRVAIGGNPAAIGFLATPWIWMTGVAVHMLGRESRQRSDLAGVANGLPSYRTT